MQVLVASNDQKRSAHLTRLVRQLENDKRRGQTHLPEQLFQRLKELSKIFRQKQNRVSGDNGRKIMAIQKRNQTTRRLSFLVRDVYVMAKRKYERGDFGPDIMARHAIPTGPVRDNERKTGIWIERAHLLLDGDKEHSRNNPSLLRDPTPEELERTLHAAEEALGAANIAIDNFSTHQEELKAMRKEVDHLINKARYGLVASYYALSGANLRECLFAYGYRFRRAKASDAETIETPTKPQTQQPRQHTTAPLQNAFNYGPSQTAKAQAAPPTPQQVDPKPTASQETPKTETIIQPTEAKTTQLKVTDPDLRDAIYIENPKEVKPKQGVQKIMNKISEEAAKREANQRARYGGQKPKRKKRPKKGK